VAHEIKKQITKRLILVPAPSRGKGSLPKGLAYEDTIRTALKTIQYNNISLVVPETSAGAGHGQDITVDANGVAVKIECKDKGAFEGGGKVYKVVGDALAIEDDCLHKTLLTDYIPFKGRIPSFLKGDKSLSMWTAEKDQFKDEHVEAASTVIADYYKAKGTHYIQVEGKGLYTTGNDILGLGVPIFSCETTIRIRCKRHTSSTMPSSVQAALTYKKNTLAASSFNLQATLPATLTRVAI
jgi:hypothetical protein